MSAATSPAPSALSEVSTSADGARHEAGGIGAAGRRAVRRIASNEATTRTVLRVARRLIHGAFAAGLALLAIRSLLAPWTTEAWELPALLLGTLGTFGGGVLVLAIGLVRLRHTGPYPLAAWMLALGLVWHAGGALRETGARAAWEARRAEMDALMTQAERAAETIARIPAEQGRIVETLPSDGGRTGTLDDVDRRAARLGLHGAEVDERGDVHLVAAWSVRERIGYQRVAAGEAPPPPAERMGRRTFRREPLGDGWWLVRTSVPW